MNHRYLLVVCTLILTACIPCFAGLSPCNVAVVVNVDSSASEAVGRYYCEKAGIPLSNLIEVQTSPLDGIYPDEFATLAQRIREKLVSRLGVDPDDFANDTIQALVMCYGVPTTITGSYQDANMSVDSFLTLLFNSDPDVGPTEYPCVNPYFGKDIDFASFRASSTNLMALRRMRYMVCRLDA